MNKKYENRPVDLLYLFWNIVFAWRTLLVWMLVFGLLMTGYAGLKYKSGLTTYHTEFEAYQAAQRGDTIQEQEPDSEVVFTAEQQMQIQDAIALQKRITKTRTYIGESILMNIDPYSENVLTLNFYVDNGYTFNYTRENAKDDTCALLDAYVDYVNSGAVAQALAEGRTLESDVKYIQELISAEEKENGFSVRLVYKDDSIFNDAAECIEKSLSSQTKIIEDKIGKHSLDEVSSVQAVQSDSDTAAFQANVMNNLNSYCSQYSALAATMDEQQLAQVDKEVKSSEVEEGTESVDASVDSLSEPVPPVFSVKYSILGVLLGFFLACVWIALKQIFSNKLQHAQELVQFFDLNQIGVLHGNQVKNANGLDQWLMRLRYRNRKELDDDTRLGIVCGNLELMCKRENLARVCLTGTEIDKLRKTDEAVMNTITERLSGAGVQIIFADNICYDMNAMRTVNEVGAVVLVEQAQVSIYQEIDRELMMLKQNEVSVVGAIGID